MTDAIHSLTPRIQTGDYLEKHGIYELLSSLLSELAVQQPTDPLTFLVQHL
jgi:hypothetical protein